MSVLLGGGVVVVYSTIGGMWSLTLTDIVQFVIKTVGLMFILLPICLLIAVDSWNCFLIASQTREASSNPGGLIWWPIKLAIPVAFTLLSLQGLSETIKNIAVLTGHRPMPHFKGGH